VFETLTNSLSSAFSSLRGTKELTSDNVDEGLAAVRAALLEADVHFKVARDLTEKVRGRVLGEAQMKGVDPSQQFIHAVNLELTELMGPEDATLNVAKSGPTVILMAGLQGAGKTTTCGKLGRYLREKHKKQPLLVAADIKRPAAVEQLRVLGKQLDLPVFFEEGKTPPEVCAAGVAHAKAMGYDVVILDTAGRLHVDDELMGEVAEIAKRTKPDNQILVVDGMTGQDAVRSAGAFHERLELTGVILTKTDGDARGGAVVSLKAVTGCPVLFVGTGEKPEDLDAFSPERMAGRILGMGDVVGLVEKAQETISEEEAEASYNKMVMGSFTLEDMFAQLRMIRKMGSMKKLLGMMPGMSGLSDAANIDESVFDRQHALYDSMTPKERIHPDLIDISRRRRIARGAGQDLSAVNELLKGFRGMQKMMKQMGKMGMGAKMGGKQKRAALEGMGGTGAGLGGGGLGGMLGGAGDMLGGMFGGKGGGEAPSMEDLQNMMPGGAKPMGSSSTRANALKKKEKARKKRKQKKKRR
jgi:signal recognition particle subunit SRP54